MSVGKRKMLNQAAKQRRGGRRKLRPQAVEN
jgi:hypothetical protein